MELLRTYYNLTKPRMVYGNAFIAACAFALASRGYINLWLLVPTLVGLSLVMAAGCVFNNYIDRDVDKKMARTKNRALAKKIIPAKHALLYGLVLASFGTGILAFYTNLLTILLAGIGFLFYVVFYSIGKRRSIHGTLVGSISGAMPPVIGYCAVSNTIDLGAIILFLILVIWQLPHFYAIAIYRFDDYAAAKIPVLPVVKGVETTQWTMLVYIVGFGVAVMTLYFFGYTGTIYLVGASLLVFVWLLFCIKGFARHDTKRWARKMFFVSLVVLMVLFSIIGLDSVLYF